MAKPVAPNPKLARRVRELVDRTSIAEASRLLDLAEATTARLAGGLKVTPGTAAYAEQRLEKVGEAA